MLFIIFFLYIPPALHFSASSSIPSPLLLFPPSPPPFPRTLSPPLPLAVSLRTTSQVPGVRLCMYSWKANQKSAFTLFFLHLLLSGSLILPPTPAAALTSGSPPLPPRSHFVPFRRHYTESLREAFKSSLRWLTCGGEFATVLSVY